MTNLIIYFVSLLDIYLVSGGVTNCDYLIQISMSLPLGHQCAHGQGKV